MSTMLIGKEALELLVGGKTDKDKVVAERHAFLSVEEGSSLRRGCCEGSVKWIVTTVSLAVTVLLLGAGLLTVHVYHTRTVDSLTLRLDVLKKDVDNLNHRLLEENLLSELKAFKDAVYAEEGAEYSADDDYDDYVEQEDPVTMGSPTNYDHSEGHKNKRPKREVYGYNGGVPIISESYGISNKTEGLRLYESLIASPPEIVYETTENPIKDHHRVSSSWPSKHRKKYHGQRGHKVEGNKKVLPSSPIISRPSRVMQTDTDPTRRVSNISLAQPVVPPQPIKKHEGEIHVRVYQEHRAPPQSTVRALDVLEAETPRRRRRKPTRKLSSIETLDERPPVMARHRLLPAAHYDGDTSQYPVQHEHYDGNGRLRHPDGVFADWTASKWVQQLGMERHFRLDGGVVNIQDTGLYFVYAQVHYLDEHDINGYRVYVNEEPMLQCTTMTHSVGRERVKKSNTCFTGAALFLRENDQLSLRDIGGLRYSLFETGKSFFGLIKLGSVSIK